MKSIKFYSDTHSLESQLIKEKADAQRYLQYARKNRIREPKDLDCYFYFLHMVQIHMRRIREILERLKNGCDGTFNLEELEI